MFIFHHMLPLWRYANDTRYAKAYADMSLQRRLGFYAIIECCDDDIMSRFSDARLALRLAKECCCFAEICCHHSSFSSRCQTRRRHEGDAVIILMAGMLLSSTLRHFHHRSSSSPIYT